MIADWIAQGAIADVVLGLMAVEAFVLLCVRSISGRGLPAASVAANLLAGGFLVAALRYSLTGSDPWFIALCLAGALVAHISDIMLRWQ